MGRAATPARVGATRETRAIWLPPTSAALHRLSRTIVERVRAEVPEYALDGSGQFAEEAEFAVAEALRCFLRGVATGRRDSAESDEVFRRLGRLEADAGRTHDTLQTAYRIASQVVMAHLLTWEQDLGMPRGNLAQVSTEMFEFIDHLATMSGQGFAQACELRTDAFVSRARLLALLIRPEPTTRGTVARHAQRLGWTVPERAAVIEVSSPRPLAEAQLGALARAVFGDGALGGRFGRRQLMLAPAPLDPDRIRARLARRAPGLRVVCGPTVAITGLGASATVARRASVLADSAHDDPVVMCADLMLDLVLDAGHDTVRLLAPSRLEPLLGLSAAKRLKYGRLLSAWLELGSLRGDAPGILDKHRQTLRYQQGQLERMFGEQLSDRTARLELMLALRAVLPRWEDEVRGPHRERRVAPVTELVREVRIPG